MNFTDIFIKRPVLAMVVSLLIVVLGLRSLFSLPVNQYPKTQNAVVTISTTYYGADAQTVAGFITQPLEGAIAQAQGIDYLSSSSSSGVSTITATLRLNYDANRALTEINTQVQSVRNQLPAQAQAPVLTVATGSTIDAMYLGFYSDTLPTNDVTDFLQRVVKPKLDSVEGVQTAELLGARLFALRAWLDSNKLAAHNLTASDVSAALASNNYLAALGASKGQMVTVPLTAGTDLHTVDEFKKLAVKQSGDAIVRLEDVATVTLGSETYDFNVAFSGVRSVFIGIKVAPEANILDVAKRVRAGFPAIRADLPGGLTGEIVYDSTSFINTSISEVVKTLVEALLIVTVVIYLFLGSFRAVIVPVIAMPLSLIGTFFVMLALGYSINLLTLLALVLAIGLVVDDAIIVVENVDRHMKEDGKSPMQAAFIAARELGSPIIAMTVVLIAVYVPIGFQGGLTGALFTEFAFTLAGSVAVSGIVALTLSPMMASRFFKADQESGRFARFIDRNFERLQHGYGRLLHSLLDTWVVLVVMGVILSILLVVMFRMSQSELAPEEDQGIVVSQVVGPPTATSDQMQAYADQVFKVAAGEPEYAQMFQITGVPTVNQGIGGVLLKTWEDRTRNAKQLQKDLQAKWNRIAGARVAAFQFPALPGSTGLPVQFVITTTEPFGNLNTVAQQVVDRARAQNKFYFADVDLKLDKPQATVVVDRDKVAALGMTQQDVGASLGAALGGGYVNYFSIAGRSYKVIPQVLQVDRLNPADVLDFYIRTPNAGLIPASTVASIRNDVVPEAITRFQQLNSATISGVSGASQGEILQFLRDTLKEVAPTGYTVDYSGQSRQYVQESGGFLVTMGFAIVIVFLALAAQFESFRDPIVILVSVPLALFGALIFIFLGFASMNIYTEVGLVTLMGLISKHGILIVEVANQLQKAGRTKRQAIEEATGIRLRPILMTTAAMVFGVVPLVIASGAGAAGRQAMGIVIFTGLSIGTLFTLFVVPAMYLFIGSVHKKDGAAGEAEVTKPVATSTLPGRPCRRPEAVRDRGDVSPMRCRGHGGSMRARTGAAVVMGALWLGGCAAPPLASPPAGSTASTSGAAAAAAMVVSVYVLPPLGQPAPVLIDAAPPPMLVEPPPPSAVLGAVWTGGYWAWQGSWVWAAGRWAPPPRPGDVWVQPTYEHRDGAVIFIDAHWRPVRTAFVPVRPGQRIARAALATGAELAPLATGPEGYFVPPPPGSRPGLVVPAPLGTPPALMMALPPVGQVGMRVSAVAAGGRPAGRGIDVGLVRVTAPAAATLDGRAYDASLPAEAYLAASMPPVVRVLAPAPRAARAMPSYEAGQPAPPLPAAQAVGSDRTAPASR